METFINYLISPSTPSSTNTNTLPIKARNDLYIDITRLEEYDKEIKRLKLENVALNHNITFEHDYIKHQMALNNNYIRRIQQAKELEYVKDELREVYTKRYYGAPALSDFDPNYIYYRMGFSNVYQELSCTASFEGVDTEQFLLFKHRLAIIESVIGKQAAVQFHNEMENYRDSLFIC